jgi:hypothetical protein
LRRKPDAAVSEQDVLFKKIDAPISRIPLRQAGAVVMANAKDDVDALAAKWEQFEIEVTQAISRLLDESRQANRQAKPAFLESDAKYVRFARFDYTDGQWAEIEETLRCLQPSQAALEDARMRLRSATRKYLLQTVMRGAHQIQKKNALQEWKKISKCATYLLVFLPIALVLEPDGEVPEESDFLSDMKFALLKLLKLASHHSGKLEAIEYPKATPQAWFQFYVLEVWTDLGGKLQFSRHPTNHKIKGPLAKYFSLAAQSFTRGSIETLPDILKRQKKMKAALENRRTVVAAGILEIEKIIEKGATSFLNGD